MQTFSQNHSCSYEIPRLFAEALQAEMHTKRANVKKQSESNIAQ